MIEEIVFFIVLLFCSQPSHQTCENELSPNRVGVYDALPGDFFGNSTRPADCTVLPCIVATLSDGVVGYTSQMVDSSQFLAWNEDFRVALVVFGGDSLVGLRTIHLHFYHDPSIGAVLPELVFRASNSDSVPGDQPIPYTFTNNQDLTTTDSQIRSVTIVLANNISTGNRLHISSSLKSGQQFVLSEVVLCSDPVVLVAEPLSVNPLSGASELANGSVIEIPANKTIRSGNYTLSCTVVNQGRFQWEWTVPNSMSVTPEILDATRTSVIEVPQSTSSVGEYTCTARYHTDSGLQNADPGFAMFSVELELILYASETVVQLEGTLVILVCTLAGDESVMVDIQWSFEGHSLTDSSKYSVLSSNNSPCVYGTCHNSQLQIRNANSDDEGDYTCSYGDHTQEITVTNTPTESPPISSISSPISTPPPPTPGDESSQSPPIPSIPNPILIPPPIPTPPPPTPGDESSQSPLVVGVIVAGCVSAFILGLLIATVLFVVVVVVVVSRRRRLKLGELPINETVELPTLPPNSGLNQPQDYKIPHCGEKHL